MHLSQLQASLYANVILLLFGKEWQRFRSFLPLDVGNNHVSEPLAWQDAALNRFGASYPDFLHALEHPEFARFVSFLLYAVGSQYVLGISLMIVYHVFVIA